MHEDGEMIPAKRYDLALIAVTELRQQVAALQIALHAITCTPEVDAPRIAKEALEAIDALKTG